MAGGIGAFGGDYSGINQAVADRNANWRTMQQLIESQTARRQQSRQQEAALKLQRELGMRGLDLEQQGLGQRGTQFDRTFGLQERQMEQGGSQFNANLELQRMLGMGSQDIQRAGLAQSGEQFDKSLGFQRERGTAQDTQFDRSLGQREREFTAGLGESQADRTQRGDQFTASLQDRGLDRQQQFELAELERVARSGMATAADVAAMKRLRAQLDAEAAGRTESFANAKELHGTYADKAKDETKSAMALRYLEGLLKEGRMDEAHALASTGDYDKVLAARPSQNTPSPQTYGKTAIPAGTDEESAKAMAKYDWLMQDEVPIVQQAEDKVKSASWYEADPDVAEEVIPSIKKNLVELRKGGIRTVRDRTVEGLLREMLLLSPQVIDRNVSMWSNELLGQGSESSIGDFLYTDSEGVAQRFKQIMDELSSHGVKVKTK